jgi:hypothetical protein
VEKGSIVDYIVDESLKAYLARALNETLPTNKKGDATARLDTLFAYTEREHGFSAQEVDALVAAIDTCKILDPACGSGAFPMGILHKLVFILGKLDPKNEKWRDRQIAKAEEMTDVEAGDSSVRAIERDFADNALDYGRKLYLWRRYPANSHPDFKAPVFHFACLRAKSHERQSEEPRSSPATKPRNEIRYRRCLDLVAKGPDRTLREPEGCPD